jgi:2-dehydropantoate 2-reductase
MEDASIAIVGSGAIGLYYGAKLAHSGHDVRFLMRSGLDEARRESIRVFSTTEGDLHVERPSVHPSSHDIGPVDLVLRGLKTTQNAAIETLIPPLLHANTALLTMQNGLGNEEFLAARFGAERVLGGLCFVCLTRETPASVNHYGYGALSIGEFGRPPQDRTGAIVDAFSRSGIKTKLVDDLIAERWRKLVWNIPFNGLCVVEGGITVDIVLATPALHNKCRALMEETIRAANALGHPIDPAYADTQIERTWPMGAYQPSTLTDFLAGRELEIESIWGEPLRQAARAGVPTPHLAALYDQLTNIQHSASNIQ